jgi:hypothetical protein
MWRRSAGCRRAVHAHVYGCGIKSVHVRGGSPYPPRFRSRENNMMRPDISENDAVRCDYLVCRSRSTRGASSGFGACVFNSTGCEELSR